MVEYRFARELRIDEPLALPARRFCSLYYGMLATGLSQDSRKELDELLDGRPSGLTQALIEEGVDAEVARLRGRLSTTKDVNERARLMIQIQAIHEKRRKEESDG